jgi:hypothetical protein
MIEIKLEKFDKNNPDLDLMTINDWKDYVKSGGFIDYDGFGFLSTSTYESNLRVYPSYLSKDKIIKVSIDFEKPKRIKQKDIKQFTHIIWYNR